MSIKETAPAEYFCPITLDLMIDPVVAADGWSYERSAIENFFQKNLNDLNLYSPMTGEPLATKILVPNIGLRNLINDYKERVALNVRLSNANDKNAEVENIAQANNYADSLVVAFGNDVDRTAAFYNYLGASNELREKLNTKLRTDPDSVVGATRYMNQCAQLDHNRNKAFEEYYQCSPENKNKLINDKNAEVENIAQANNYANSLVVAFGNHIDRTAAFYDYLGASNERREILCK